MRTSSTRSRRPWRAATPRVPAAAGSAPPPPSCSGCSSSSTSTDWSFDECEREVRGSLVYRAFCRIDGERVPDAKTLIRLAHVLDGPVLKHLLERLATIARQRRVIHGRRLRVDTTVVETTIHYPTDSALLADGVRVLTRTMKRLTARLGSAQGSTSAIGRAAWPVASSRSRTTPARRRRERATRSGSRARPGCASSTGGCCGSRGASSARPSAPSDSVASIPRPRCKRLRARLRATSTWSVASWRRPELGCSRRHPLSRQGAQPLRVPHRSHPQRQGRQAHRVRQARQDPGSRSPLHHRLHGLCDAGARSGAVGSSLDRTRSSSTGRRTWRSPIAALPRAPMSVRRASSECVTSRCRDNAEKAAAPRSAALRWRTGCEGRISVLKRRHGLRRCRYRGLPGMERWVGLGVIANNLLVLGLRALEPRTETSYGSASPDGRRRGSK